MRDPAKSRPSSKICQSNHSQKVSRIFGMSKLFCSNWTTIKSKFVKSLKSCSYTWNEDVRNEISETQNETWNAKKDERWRSELCTMNDPFMTFFGEINYRDAGHSSSSNLLLFRPHFDIILNRRRSTRDVQLLTGIEGFWRTGRSMTRLLDGTGTVGY